MTFCYVSDPAESNVRLFKVGTNTDAAITAENGKLKVVSTGKSAGPGGPPPGAGAVSGDHFNFGTLQSTELTRRALYLPFADVNEKHWSYHEIYDMAETGIMLGMSQTKFAPVDDMNRAMAITVLYRMAGSPEVTGT